MDAPIRLWQPQWFLDPVTRLPNRTLFLNRLHAALTASPVGGWRPPVTAAVFIVDVYEYEFIKQRYGRRFALALLREVAHRLERCIGPGDTAARLGDGVFAVLREVGRGSVSVSTTASRLREALGDAFGLTTGGGTWSPEIEAGGTGRVVLRLSPRLGAVVAPVHALVSSADVLALARHAVERATPEEDGSRHVGPSFSFVELLEPAFIDVAKK